MEYTKPTQRIHTTAVNSIISQLHWIKYLVAAAGVLIAFLVDKRLGPAEDDLPLRFKIILAAPIIVAVFYAQALTVNQRAEELPYIFGCLITTILLYTIVWSLFGYKKEVDVPRPWWRPWGKPYKTIEIRVMGGSINRRAKEIIQRDTITVQTFFKGTAYKQDEVWMRMSRALLQALLVLVYMAVIFCYTLTIAAVLS